jgi:hypothetical protein
MCAALVVVGAWLLASADTQATLAAPFASDLPAPAGVARTVGQSPRPAAPLAQAEATISVTLASDLGAAVYTDPRGHRIRGQLAAPRVDVEVGRPVGCVRVRDGSYNVEIRDADDFVKHTGCDRPRSEPVLAGHRLPTASASAPSETAPSCRWTTDGHYLVAAATPRQVVYLPHAVVDRPVR